MMLPVLHIPFDERKASEAASFLLARSGRCLSRWRFNKLMYLAEREAWKRLGRSMFGGAYFSLDYGPVVSEVLSLTSDQATSCEGDIWSAHFKNIGTKVQLKRPLPPARLTRGDVEVLHSVFLEYGGMPRDTLGSYMHRLPEYRQTTPRTKRWPIPLGDLLKKLGKTPESIAQVSKRIREDEAIERLHQKLAAHSERPA